MCLFVILCKHSLSPVFFTPLQQNAQVRYMQGSPKRPKSQDERAMSEARDARNNGVVSKDNTDEHQQKRVKWLTKTNLRLCSICSPNCTNYCCVFHSQNLMFNIVTIVIPNFYPNQALFMAVSFLLEADLIISTLFYLLQNLQRACSAFGLEDRPV